MLEERARRAVRRFGLVTARAAHEAGLDQRDIRLLVASGAWVAIRRGVYVDEATWAAADEWRGRPRLRARAVHLSLAHPHVFSHDSAAAELDLPLMPDAHTWVHVTRTGITGSRRRRGVAQHGAPFDEHGVSAATGLPVLSAARTALDIAREHGYAAGLAACDGALRLGVPREELVATAASMRRWPGIRGALAAAEDADPGAENAGESLARILVRSLGAGQPRTQFPVLLEDGSTAWLDLLVGCHAFEFDGQIKVRSPADGGVAVRGAEKVLWDEKKRERLIRPLGLGISRIVWIDTTSGIDAARRRLVTEYRQTLAVHGDRLPPALEEYAARMAPHRARRLRAK